MPTRCPNPHDLSTCPRQAVDALGTYCGKEVPIKKLLLWLEMARQELPDPTAKIPLAAWQTVLQDLSS
jgi:vesicle-fusing ATPase